MLQSVCNMAINSSRRSLLIQKCARCPQSGKEFFIGISAAGSLDGALALLAALAGGMTAPRFQARKHRFVAGLPSLGRRKNGPERGEDCHTGIVEVAPEIDRNF